MVGEGWGVSGNFTGEPGRDKESLTPPLTDSQWTSSKKQKRGKKYRQAGGQTHTDTHTHKGTDKSTPGFRQSCWCRLLVNFPYPGLQMQLRSGELDKFPWLTWFPSHVYLWILVCLCHTVVSMSPHWLHPTYRGQGMSSQCPHFTHSHTQTKEHFTSTSVPPLLQTHSHLWHLADALIQNNRLHFYIQSIYTDKYSEAIQVMYLHKGSQTKYTTLLPHTYI